MIILDSKRDMGWFEKAKEVAKKSTCTRSLCGAILIKGEEIIGQGFNSPPNNSENQRRCARKSEIKTGFKSDKTCCMHAEQRAILDALKNNPNKLEGSTMYFGRTDILGNVELCRPYCTICSKMIVDVGVKEMVLLQKEGLTSYGAEEYSDKSFAYDGEH